MNEHYEVILFNEEGIAIHGFPVQFLKCRAGLTQAINEVESLVTQGCDRELISLNYRNDDTGERYSVYDVEWGGLYHGEELNESMDGDFDSAMTSAGFGTDEDYGYFGEDY